MTKIDIISGFLGAGKTTLIKKLITEHLYQENVVLIENEFGEIGIDGGFLKDAGIEIKEMNSGCICCSLVGDFAEALEKVIEEYHPDRIIIEPSGVGKLSDVEKAVHGLHNHDIVLNSLTTIADASKCSMYMKNFGEFYNNQIEHANTIILSRTQDMNNATLEDVVQKLQNHNDHAAIITTPWDQLTAAAILQTIEQQDVLETTLYEDADICPLCANHHEHGEHHHEHGNHEHHDHHHVDEVFSSWGMETPKKYTKEQLEAILSKLDDEAYGTILRAKGMLESIEGSWLYFDYVPKEYEIRSENPSYTGRLCVIGSNINKTALQALFQL